MTVSQTFYTSFVEITDSELEVVLEEAKQWWKNNKHKTFMMSATLVYNEGTEEWMMTYCFEERIK